MERPEQLSDLGVLPWALMAAGLGVLLWAWPVLRRGEGAFDGTPPRNVGLRGLDLLVGLGIMLVMMSAAGSILRTLVTFDPQTGQIIGISQTAKLMLQLSIMLMGATPTIVYMCIRAWMSGQQRWAQRLGLVPRRPEADVWLAAKAILVAVPLVLGVGSAMQVVGVLIGQPAPALGHEMLQTLATTDSPSVVIMIILMAVVIAPLIEESIYRGLVQTSLRGMMRRIGGDAGGEQRWLVIASSAVMFGLIHANVAAWHGLPGLIVLGVVLGYVYEKSGSLWPGILVHAAFNTLNLAIVWTMKMSSS